jgi:hypothetical protein
VGAWALLASSIAAVAFARPRAVASTRAATAGSDVFALPPPALLNALSLGYRSALADLLYTSTAISYGIHHEEHRRFEFVGQYLDSIVALDPHFCQTYRYADTFIIYQPVGEPSPDDVRHARRLLEKGLEMCPSDGHLWLSAGQFMALMGVQFLKNEDEKEEFRVAGAKMLARAAELTDNQNVQWQSLAAASIFSREGNREATIAFLNRVYNVTDNEELKAKVDAQLKALNEERWVDRIRRHADAFNRVSQNDLPFVSRSHLLVVGPPRDPFRCSGETPGSPGCAGSWADWPFDDDPR